MRLAKANGTARRFKPSAFTGSSPVSHTILGAYPLGFLPRRKGNWIHVGSIPSAPTIYRIGIMDALVTILDFLLSIVMWIVLTPGAFHAVLTFCTVLCLCFLVAISRYDF